MNDMEPIQFTHKGWFGVCPVYYADIEADCPMVDPRLPRLFMPLLLFSSFMYQVVMACVMAIDPSVYVGFPLYITGALEKPITRMFPVLKEDQ